MRKISLFIVVSITALFFSTLFLACTPSGRIKTGEEGDLVGANKGGSPTYNQLIAEASRKLLDSAANKERTEGTRQICFVGIENQGIEELGDIRAATNQEIETVLFQSQVFDMISQRYVDSALRETSLRPSDIFLRNNQERFLGVLRDNGQDPDYLLWAIYTTLSTAGESESQRDYLLTLELIDVETGRLVEKETAKVRKAYEK